jgi:hypothetical protein
MSGEDKTLTDPRLCAAIVDRLTFIETGTDLPARPHHRPTKRLARHGTSRPPFPSGTSARGADEPIRPV